MQTTKIRLANGELWPIRMVDRFWGYIDADGDCWRWKGFCIPTGYGYFMVHTIYPKRRNIGVHRLAWQMLVGTIPPKMTIDHMCKVRNCVNPSHMRLLTRAANTMAGSSVPAMNERKTECKRGHPFDSSNTVIDNRGYRQCRICNRLRHEPKDIERGGVRTR